MRKECYEAARALKLNNEIVISRPDKGSGVVVLDRTDYINKMLVILEDRSKFRQLGPAVTFDYTLKIEQAFQNGLMLCYQTKRTLSVKPSTMRYIHRNVKDLKCMDFQRPINRMYK